MLHLTAIIASVLIMPIMAIRTNSFRFGVIGDTQARPAIFRAAANDMRRQNLSFAVHLGDIHWCSSYAAWDRSRKVMNSTKVPWYITFGNHEAYRCAGRRHTWAHYRRLFSTYWYQIGDTFRSWQFGNYRFAILDTASNILPAGQVVRLRAIYKQANKSGQRVFIFSHRPLPARCNFGIRHGSTCRWYSRLDSVSNSRQGVALTQLINSQHGATAALFHGHYHAYLDYRLGKVQVYCSGGGGGTLQTKYDYYHWLRVDVTNNSYKINIRRINKRVKTWRGK